jgi:low affinity Fe/Cu permease
MVARKKSGHPHETPAPHPGLPQTRIARFLNQFAEFLSTAIGFVATFVVLCIGIAIGALVHFNDLFMFGFNLFLSILAIVISGIILVSGARSEAALHVKLDYLIRYSKAKNDAIGLEHKDVQEIEAERQAIEESAKKELEDVVEREVEEEVSEQLGKAGKTAARKRKPVGAR